MRNRNIIFIIPDERKIYKDFYIKTSIFHLPSLAFAILGVIAKENGFNPVVLDLTLEAEHKNVLREKLSELKPVYVGITCTSASYFLASEIAKFVRIELPDTKILVGGPHVSSTAEETLRDGYFDYLFMGEAEKSFASFLKGVNPENIEGLAFKKRNSDIRVLPNPSFLENLDDLPYPDYSLYNLSKYRLSKLTSRRNPVVWIETSRGCPFNCKICNKVVQGYNFRPKSVRRLLDELEYLAGMGVKEFHIADDCFTLQIERAEAICDGIIDRGLDITWACSNGIRVDRVNQVLLEKMRRAGCYRIAFGIESGNQGVLNNLGKNITLEQVIKAVQMAKKAGMEVHGFFIFGFLDDTEATMQETIELAKRLPLDVVKVALPIPFPGSPLYAEYSALGLLYNPGDYRDFNMHISPKYVYRHPTLNWDLVEKYIKDFYRGFYLNPKYIIREVIGSIKNKTLISALWAVLTETNLRKIK